MTLYHGSMPAPETHQRMRDDWGRRAREDALYYVAFGRRAAEDGAQCAAFPPCSSK